MKKAELCYVYGYGCVLPSLNYKVKKKRGKASFVIQLVLAIIDNNLESVEQTDMR